MIGLDPGPTHSALVVVSGGLIAAHHYCDNWAMRDLLAEYGHHQVRDPSGPFMLTIEEMQSYGMAAGRSMFQTCVWAGRFAELYYQRCAVEAAWLPRPQVKLRLCGTVRANDRDVREELLHRYGPQGTKKQPGPTYGMSGDKWAALAVATAALIGER